MSRQFVSRSTSDGLVSTLVLHRSGNTDTYKIDIQSLKLKNLRWIKYLTHYFKLGVYKAKEQFKFVMSEIIMEGVTAMVRDQDMYYGEGLNHSASYGDGLVHSTSKELDDTLVEEIEDKQTEDTERVVLQRSHSVDNIEEEVNMVTKKGLSITRALVLFGYESWTALEPRKY